MVLKESKGNEGMYWVKPWYWGKSYAIEPKEGKQDFSPKEEPYATWIHGLDVFLEGFDTFDVMLEMRRYT